MKHLGKYFILCALIYCSSAYSNDNKVHLDQDLYEVKTRTVEILRILVEQGILTKEQALDIVKKSEKNAKEKYQTSTDLVTDEQKDVQPNDNKVVRVPYVPEYIRNQIRDQVRMGLREDVANDILGEAKTKQWGVPGAWPEWIKRIKPYGDIRLRLQSDTFDDDNSMQIPNNQAINEAGGLTAAGDDIFLNTTEDRQRQRLRFRAGVKAKVTEGLAINARLATGKQDDPVSTNQTLGAYNSPSTINLDRAYIKYNNQTESWILNAGRIKNPWFSSDLIWDSDVNFDGFAATYHWRRSDNIFDEDERNFDPFITLGAFPIQEVELSSKDKWLYGFQVGFDYLFDSQNRLRMGLAFYDYQNITGILNDPNRNEFDFTAAEFLQFGNTLFDIDGDGDRDTQENALASDFDLLALTLSYDIARFVPAHIIFDAEIVENIGFDEDDILERTGAIIRKRNKGYKVKLTVGWPQIRKKHDWQVSLAYKSLQRDAVLDAFTDSDFHLGGTDAKGYIFATKYGLSTDTYMQIRILSADEIDGNPFGTNTAQIDFYSRF